MMSELICWFRFNDPNKLPLYHGEVALWCPKCTAACLKINIPDLSHCPVCGDGLCVAVGDDGYIGPDMDELTQIQIMGVIGGKLEE